MKKTIEILKAMFTPDRKPVNISKKVKNALYKSPWSASMYEADAVEMEIVREFIDSGCVCAPQYWISTSRLFLAMKVWCREDPLKGEMFMDVSCNRMKEPSFKNFATAVLSTPGIKNKEDQYDPYFQGICITADLGDKMDKRGMEG